MKFFETSKYFTLKKSIYVNLRWIGIFGQLFTVSFVYLFLDFRFNFILTNLVIILGALSNIFLIYRYQKNLLTEKISFIFLSIDIIQLSLLIYLTGGISNPFVIFLIIPSIFASSNLGFKPNLMLALITTFFIIFLTII